jgi:hypothetical protein
MKVWRYFFGEQETVGVNGDTIVMIRGSEVHHALTASGMLHFTGQTLWLMAMNVSRDLLYVRATGLEMLPLDYGEQYLVLAGQVVVCRNLFWWEWDEIREVEGKVRGWQERKRKEDEAKYLLACHPLWLDSEREYDFSLWKAVRNPGGSMKMVRRVGEEELGEENFQPEPPGTRRVRAKTYRELMGIRRALKGHEPQPRSELVPGYDSWRNNRFWRVCCANYAGGGHHPVGSSGQ